MTWRKHERAVEDAGPYGVRERGRGRANRGTDPSPYGVCPSGCAGE
nr:MAG TPA: Nematocyst outer wall antigen evolution, nematocyst, bridge state [Caudoviricetes sp.]